MTAVSTSAANSSAMSALEVQLQKELKTRALLVSNCEAVSAAEAECDSLHSSEKDQNVPNQVLEKCKNDTSEERRRLVCKIIGMAPLDRNFSLNDIKYERTSRYLKEED